MERNSPRPWNTQLQFYSVTISKNGGRGIRLRKEKKKAELHCAEICSPLCVCVFKKTTSCAILVTSSFESGSLVDLSSLIKLDGLASEDAPVSDSLDYKCAPLYLTFLHVIWKLNPGPPEYKTGTLPTEASPGPPVKGSCLEDLRGVCHAGWKSLPAQRNL